MSELQIFDIDSESAFALPYADGGVRAGFPSPAQEMLTDSIDLNRALVQHAEATFYARAVGDSLIEADVHEGDLLVVDRALEAHEGDMAVCCINGDFTLKFIHREGERLLLMPANKKYKPIEVSEDDDFTVWGIVTYVIRKVR